MRNIKKILLMLILTIIILLICYVFYLKKQLSKNEYQLEDVITEDITENSITETSSEEYCLVDIKGAILNSGVYKLKCSSTVNDAIKEAGGITKEGNTSLLNLAKKIEDEMVIIIYTNEEVNNSNIVKNVVKIVEKECVCPNIQNDGCLNNEITDGISNQDQLININTATEEELLTITGIGEAKAKAIIKYREENGNFNSIEDIQNVDGIGKSLYEQIKAYIKT